jgi:hypothetical protein
MSDLFSFLYVIYSRYVLFLAEGVHRDHCCRFSGEGGRYVDCLLDCWHRSSDFWGNDPGQHAV